MRLIDADALKNSFDSAYTVFGQCVYAKGIVDRQPTIEPEVRHGRWKKKKGAIYCTNCKKSRWSESFDMMLRGFEFCPKCGARMDGGADNAGRK